MDLAGNQRPGRQVNCGTLRKHENHDLKLARRSTVVVDDMDAQIGGPRVRTTLLPFATAIQLTIFSPLGKLVVNHARHLLQLLVLTRIST
jgi:hypothetical protein